MPLPRIARRTLPPLAIAVLLAACASAPDRTPAPAPSPAPAPDAALSPFYAWNGTLPAEPGRLLRTEPQPAQAEFTAAGDMQRILYTSDDARWGAGILPVSGTLYLPKGAPPPGGWPLVAWAHGTLGGANACAPSWALHKPRDATYLNRWLEQGFAVVATDYQGLGGPGPHPYLLWEAEGRSVLDAARAVLAANPGRLANRLVITGQSQGSGAALGAARIAPDYAPQLQVLGTIATGVVTTFPDGPVVLPEPDPNRPGPVRYTMLRLIGGSIAEDGVAPETFVSDAARPMLALARTECQDQLRDFERANKLDSSNAFTMPANALAERLLPVTDMDMGRMPAPLFLGTGLADRTLPPQRQYAAAAALCQAGNPVEWKTYAGITHNGIVNASFDDQLAFVRRLQAGQPVAAPCSNLIAPGAPGQAAKGIPFND